MTVPLLSTRTTDVELTPKRRALLKSKLFPLCRYLGDTSIAYFDVVIRKDASKPDETQYYVSVKLATPTARYQSAALASRFEYALHEARTTLKQELQQDRSRDSQSAPSWSLDSVRIA